MPLGVCVRCERAYIFGVREAALGETCPECGKRLEITSVQRLRDLPPIPLLLPPAPETLNEPGFPRLPEAVARH